MLAVDGVYPSNKTLTNDSYPLQLYTYSYYNKGNEKGKNLTNWLLTDEKQKVIASAEYVGIFGELPDDELINFDKDGQEVYSVISEFYYDYSDYIGFFKDSLRTNYEYKKLKDRTQTKTLADGKDKAATVVYLFGYHGTYDEQAKEYIYKYMRFILLTREKDSEWEVINEGEVLLYENGIIIPGGEGLLGRLNE